MSRGPPAAFLRSCVQRLANLETPDVAEVGKAFHMVSQGFKSSSALIYMEFSEMHKDMLKQPTTTTRFPPSSHQQAEGANSEAAAILLILNDFYLSVPAVSHRVTA